MNTNTEAHWRNVETRIKLKIVQRFTWEKCWNWNKIYNWPICHVVQFSTSPAPFNFALDVMCSSKGNELIWTVSKAFKLIWGDDVLIVISTLMWSDSISANSLLKFGCLLLNINKQFLLLHLNHVLLKERSGSIHRWYKRYVTPERHKEFK